MIERPDYTLSWGTGEGLQLNAKLYTVNEAIELHKMGINATGYIELTYELFRDIMNLLVKYKEEINELKERNIELERIDDEKTTEIWDKIITGQNSVEKQAE